MSSSDLGAENQEDPLTNHEPTLKYVITGSSIKAARLQRRNTFLLLREAKNDGKNQADSP